MQTTLVLLVAMGTVGSVDGIYYHLYKFRLFEHPSTRGETMLHILRGVTFAIALCVLLKGTPHGAWFWGLAAVFGADLVIDVVDVSLEPRSRESLGGLPAREYLVHMVVMALSGGIWTSFLMLGFPLRTLPGALVPGAVDRVPAWLLWDGRLLVAGALMLAALELVLWMRAGPTARAAMSRSAS